MPIGAENGGKDGVGGSPADLFENSEETALVGAAAPFRGRAMPAGPGRPKGSANKRTVDMRDLYLRSGFPHPLLWQGAMLRMGVDGLASELGCDKIEAAEILRKIAADAAPYIEAKMPMKVDIGDKGLPVLLVGDVGREVKSLREANQDGSLAIDDDFMEAVEYQRLSAPDARGSHGEGSHGGAQAVDPAPPSSKSAAD